MGARLKVAISQMLKWSFRSKGLVALSVLVTLALFFGLGPSLAAEGPDPATVQRWKAGWRYPQAGWTVAHIEGEPYERGLQHGHLLAPEIAAYVQALAQFWGPEAPRQAWEQTRTLANALFLRGFTQEQLQEMKGIADGAAAEGASFDGRSLDLVDIVTLNTSNEIDTLDPALAATPTGLESLRPTVQPGKPLRAAHRPRKRLQRCSAFAAIGPATKDGKLLFGHVTVYDLYPANFYGIWMEVRPTRGYRFAMQTTPGGIHSGMDYSMNEAGLLLSETTLDQTQAAIAGVPLAARIRDAQQYADSIDKAAALLTRDGNGLCTAEWIMADARHNEIALLTLGAGKSVLHRSSRNEWIAGTGGFYWSDNNIKDDEVRLQTAGALDGRPSAAGAYAPSKRDTVWLRLYDENKGAMDLDFARRMLTTPEIVSAFAVDAKYTSGEMASAFQTWASFGPPVGAVLRPTAAERKKFPAIKPLVHNPWTILSASVAGTTGTQDDPPVDLPNLRLPHKPESVKQTDEPAWHGTLLPASDADIWLSTAFANYERIVALEKQRQHTRAGVSGREARDELREDLGVELSYYRSLYARGTRAGSDFPLAGTKASFRDENWYGVVTGKGVLLLHTLRGIVGKEVFDRAMDDFGRQHAGKAVSSEAFERFLQGKSSRSLRPVFDWWLNRTGLPHLSIRSAHAARHGDGWQTTVELDPAKLGPMLSVPVTVETATGETTSETVVDAHRSRIVVTTAGRPERVVVDKYGMTARSNGSPFTILTFDGELDQTLIVYGTKDEEMANEEAARLLQQALRRREHNVQPTVKADRDVVETDLRSHHLLLVGRPETNQLTARFATQVPVRFSSRSFEVRDDVYAHPETAVIAAGENPLNPRYSIVVIAGLSSLGTYQVAPQFEEETLSYAPVVVLPRGGEEEAFVAPLRELSRDLR
jgi:hypothetical protein